MNKSALSFLAVLLAGQLTVLAAVQWSTDLPAAQTQAKKDKKTRLDKAKKDFGY